MSEPLACKVRPGGNVPDFVFAQPGFFAQAVLRDLEDLPPGVKRGGGFQFPERLDRDVLELVGDDVAAAHEGLELGEIGVGRVDGAGADLGGGRVGGRLVDMDAVAEALGGVGEHAAELAAAEDADRRCRGEAWRQGVSVSFRLDRWRRTVAVCAARGCLAARVAELRRRRSARIAAAKQPCVDRAGLADREASRPGCRRASARSRAGYPCPSEPSIRRDAEHGQMRHRGGAMPGRCAAPPAPAITTLSRAVSAVVA